MHVELIDYMGSDDSIVSAARVSFANEGDSSRTEEQNERLIKYLAKHRHITPFQHPTITVRVRAPIPIRTQCFKHKIGFTENEESRRYISSKPTFFVPEFRIQADNKKQGSGGLHPDNAKLQKAYRDSVHSAIQDYEDILDSGVAEEQARFLLPQGCEVNWYWTGSLAAFARFYNQRTDSHAQLEIQELAKEIGDLISPLFPMAWEELTNES
ncbi:thymidylate synthase complementing protein [Vibrio phage 1.026.O._10N.222.49.C7]|uniref:Thymidylate synthase complementing protein n=1 Tax=Vibrio phage 1.026.O._10N.222.49.C7 TaxID=1881421 RepID=A0A2I7QML1_9CAUD|nr:thymidylate synthase [Vibrio phage 1.026.O._10N.222.49.C7]AUR82636.1 thymidylate synthase complementing protein [Vibrio phage 1.026.O._10N.222.49.C7]